MRAEPFVATIQARSGTAGRTLFRHAMRLVVVPPRRGIEVLVSYALNPIELTNQFLRFPRVRQQTRGNFSFQNLLRIFIIGGARFVIRFPH
jgi:hypothetical protein